MPDPVPNNYQFVDLLNNRLQDNTITTVRISGTSDSPLIVTGYIDLRGAIFTKPVQFEHVVFQGFVDLSDVRAERSLRLEDCTFEDSLKLADTKVDGLLSLKRSKLYCRGRIWFDFRRLKVSGLFDATLLFADGCLDMANFRGESDIWFHSVRIYAHRKHKNEKEQSIYDLQHRDEAIKKWTEPTDQSNTTYLFGKAIHLTGASIEHNVFFQNEGGNPVYIDGQIDLRARIGRQVNFAMAHIYSTPTGFAIDLEKAVIGASVFFRQTFVVGQIDLRSKVGGSISIRESTVITRRNLIAIRMENAEIKGSVVIQEKSRIFGKVELKCKIERNLLISESKIVTAVSLTAIDLTSATVYGNVELLLYTVLKGQLDLRGTFRRNVVLKNVIVYVNDSKKTIDAEEEMTYVSKKAIDAEAAMIHGSLFVESSIFKGIVDLRATIHGDVKIKCTEIITEPLSEDDDQLASDNDHGLALDMRLVEVGGSVMMREANEIIGRVAIMGRIKGNVEIVNCRIVNPKKQPSLSFNSAHIDGSVYIGDESVLIGCLDLRCRVSGDVSLSHLSILSHRSSTAVDLQSTQIGGTLYIDNGTLIYGRIDCSQASIQGALDIRPDTKDCPRSHSADNPPDQPPKIGDPLSMTLVGDLLLDYADVCGPLYIHRLDCHGRISARHLTVQGDLQLCQSFLRGRCHQCRRVVHPSDTMHLCHNFLNDQLDVSLPTELDFLGLLQLETHRWNKEQIAAMELIQTARCPTRIAFNLELADIHGQVHIFRTIFFGHVTLEDADVHGEANFANSKLCGDLMMRSTKVEGRVFIDESRRHGSSCYPQVRGVLDVSYATLKQVDIKVDPNSIESSPKLVILAGADIESFSYEGPIPSKDEAVTGILNYPLFVTEAVNIKTIQIAVANPTNSERRHTTFSPRDTLRHVIWALLCVWVCILWLVNPSALFVLFFGFYFIAMIFILKTNPHDPVSLLDHLQMTYPFSRGYYLLVERLLRSIGDDNKADEVFHMRRVRENSKPVVIPDTDEDRTRMVKERELKEQHIRPKKKLQQFWQWLLHVGMGYGVRTGRLLHIYIFLCFFNTAVFLNPRSVERPTTFVQTRSDQTIFDFRKMKDEVDQSKLKADNPWPSEGFLPDYNQEGKTEWNGWNAMFMSMRVQIPALQLVAENDWTPATRRIIIEYWPNCKWEVFSFADYASLMMILNIILIPLIIAGLTGYIKKRQSMA